MLTLAYASAVARPLDLSPRQNTILIVDDHPVCGAMLTSILRAIDSTCRIDSVATFNAMFDQLKVRPYSHVFVDHQLPDGSGLEGLTLAQTLQPYVRLAIFSGVLSTTVARKAVELGASAVIPKTLTLPELEAAVQDFLASASPATKGPSLSLDRDISCSSAVEGLVSTLSASELRVMAAVARGLANKNIAYELQLTEATVKSHLQSVFRKLRVSNRTQAVLAFRQALGER